LFLVEAEACQHQAGHATGKPAASTFAPGSSATLASQARKCQNPLSLAQPGLGVRPNRQIDRSEL